MNQIFKTMIPINYLFDILNKFFIKKGKYYEIDNIGFKKLKFYNYQKEWLNELQDFYHESKKFYVNREFTYKSFINIIRQIARLYDMRIVTLQDKLTNYKYFKYRFYIN